jgi:prepilin-type N-terminal cleavage/methylation domain-containing protein
MKAASLPPSRPSGYTLVEILVAMSIIALAIGAASQLSLSQALTEEVNQKEGMALNYAENNARLWQLGVNPGSHLLNVQNYNSSNMTVSVVSGAQVNADDDNGSSPIQLDRATVTVGYLPPGKTTPTNVSLTALRAKPERR